MELSITHTNILERIENIRPRSWHRMKDAKTNYLSPHIRSGFYKDSLNQDADPLVALFLFEMGEMLKDNPSVLFVVNGVQSLNHISYMLNLPYEACEDILDASNADTEDLSYDSMHRHRTTIRQRLEKLL